MEPAPTKRPSPFEIISFVRSKGTAFRMLCQESLIFRESTADETVTFKKL